jgi:hypothetical protein
MIQGFRGSGVRGFEGKSLKPILDFYMSVLSPKGHYRIVILDLDYNFRGQVDPEYRIFNLDSAFAGMTA